MADEGSKYNSRKFQLTATTLVSYIGIIVLMQLQGNAMDAATMGIGFTGILGQYSVANVWQKKVSP